jgi:phage terminase large subunit
MQVQDGNLYVHELNYQSENEIRAKLNNTELHQVNSHEQAEEVGIVNMYFDKLNISKNSEIICDWNRPMKIASLRRLGYEYANPSPSKSIKDGIDLLDNLRVYVTSNSTNIIYEQENYSRKVDRYGVILEEPEDFNNHTIDAIRYVALYLQSKGIITKV